MIEQETLEVMKEWQKSLGELLDVVRVHNVDMADVVECLTKQFEKLNKIIDKKNHGNNK